MRADMSKVIVERPRWGSRMRTVRRVRRLDPRHVVIDEEAVDPYPSRIGHKAHAKQSRRIKSLNENLAPLRRFLDKQVGRPWDDVWSEISAQLRPTSTVQQHVRDHVDDFVAVRTFLHEGNVYFHTTTGPRSLENPRYRWLRLYVCPTTGKLCRNDTRASWRAERRRLVAARAADLWERMRDLGPMRVLMLLDDGNWWDVQLARVAHVHVRLPDGRWVDRTPPIVDVVEAAELSTLARDARYGRRDVHAVAKRPLSKREIRRHRLRDPVA